MEMQELLIKMKSEPQTYRTILGELYGHNSHSICIRRKLNNEVIDGCVCKTLLPGTFFGSIMFYVPEKTYTLFFVNHLVKWVIYYCVTYVETALDVLLESPYVLKGTSWVQLHKNIKVDKEDIKKVI